MDYLYVHFTIFLLDVIAHHYLVVLHIETIKIGGLTIYTPVLALPLVVGFWIAARLFRTKKKH